jgi:NAD(P)H-dependent FMN reductase
MTRIGVILGSTRPGRNGEQVARWVMKVASRRDDADFDLIDLADYPLPHLDEPLPPSMGQYQNPHTQQWETTRNLSPTSATRLRLRRSSTK